MDDHQALVSSTWDADQTALCGWVNCIVRAQHQAALRGNLHGFLANADNIIRAELKAPRTDEHCSLSSFLDTVYRNLWRATNSPFASSRFETDLISGLPHLPTLPVLFRGDMDAILEQGKKQCLVQVIHDFISDKYLEPKYAKTLLKPVWLLPAALEERRSLQDEFNRQLQQKKAATEMAPQASTTEIAATKTNQAKVNADGEPSDVEMDDLEKSMENAKDVFSRARILAEWRVKKIYSMVQPVAWNGPKGHWASHDFALKRLREMLTADTSSYKRLRQFINRLKKDKAGKWYCVETAIGTWIDPGSFRDAERIEIRHHQNHTHCDTCRGPMHALCLQFQSVGGLKGQTNPFYATFHADRH